MRSDPHPIMSAGIFPPTNVLTSFAAYFPRDINFSFIMQRLHEITRLNGRYKLCKLKDQVGIADAVQPVQSLTIKQKIILCAAPCPVQNPHLRTLVTTFARCIGERRSGALLDIPDFDLEILDEEISTERIYLERLENLHKGLILYLWLSYRFKNVFVSQKMGFYVKVLVEERIDKTLSEFSASRDIQRRIRAMKKEAMKKLAALGDPDADTQDEEVEALDMEGGVPSGSEWPAELEKSTQESHDEIRSVKSSTLKARSPAISFASSGKRAEPAHQPDMLLRRSDFRIGSKTSDKEVEGSAYQVHNLIRRHPDETSISGSSHSRAIDLAAQDPATSTTSKSADKYSDGSPSLNLRKMKLEPFQPEALHLER